MIPRYTVCSPQNENKERIAKIVFLASLPDIRTRNKLKKCILLVTGDFAWMYNPNRTYVKKSAWYCSILEYRVLHEAYFTYCNFLKILWWTNKLGAFGCLKHVQKQAENSVFELWLNFGIKFYFISRIKVLILLVRCVMFLVTL